MMIIGKDGRHILYFGNDWYAENKTSSHHIAEELSNDNHVAYIECPGLRAPRTSSRDIKKIFKKLISIFRGRRIVNDNLHVYTLPKIPFYGIPGIRWINEQLAMRFVINIRRKEKVGEGGIAFFLIPHAYAAINALKGYTIVYYCIDDYSALPGVDRDIVKSMDERMIEDADIIFVASKNLFEKKKSEYPHKKIYLSPHGVDYEHFQTNVQKERKPAIYDGHKGPIIGFFGLIENWIDLELIQYLAEKRPNWSFVMIGKQLSALPEIARRMENIIFPGYIKYKDIPTYAAYFDVSILPYRLNQQVFNCNPKKLREYLALGKPIVSVRYPEVESFSDVVLIADGYQDFLNKIECALATDDPEKILVRKKKVAFCTWENRVRTIITQICEMNSGGSNAKI